MAARKSASIFPAIHARRASSIGIAAKRAANMSRDTIPWRTTTARKHIRFDADQQLGRRVRKLSQYGLATDDDDLVIARDRGRRTDDVFKLLSRHRTVRQIFQRVRGSSAPANGDTCRSAVMVGESSTIAH